MLDRAGEIDLEWHGCMHSYQWYLLCRWLLVRPTVSQCRAKLSWMRKPALAGFHIAGPASRVRREQPSD